MALLRFSAKPPVSHRELALVAFLYIAQENLRVNICQMLLRLGCCESFGVPIRVRSRSLQPLVFLLETSTFCGILVAMVHAYNHYAALLLSTLTSPCIAASLSDNPFVSSPSGQIIGHRAPNRTDTFEFLGVKYGRAPVGKLRFAPPQRYSTPNGTTYNATHWNPYEKRHYSIRLTCLISLQ